MQPPQPELEKLVIHNPAVGIEYPPSPEGVFAVVQVDGFQYKVLEDAVLMLDTKKDHQINQTVRLALPRSYSNRSRWWARAPTLWWAVRT